MSNAPEPTVPVARENDLALSQVSSHSNEKKQSLDVEAGNAAAPAAQQTQANRLVSEEEEAAHIGVAKIEALCTFAIRDEQEETATRPPCRHR